MSNQRDLTFRQMVDLSFGFFGVQIAYALQSANISRIFATLGADPHQLSFFWILPPLMGMIVQPLIGKYSDRTWCRMGRRKPYLIIGAVIAVLVMLFLPNAGSLHFSTRLFLGLNMAMWFGLFSLIFLDTSINVAMQPFKMMVGDMVNEKQKTTAYSIQSFLCNAGSLAGYLFPIFFTWIGIANTAPKGVVPDSVIWSFYCGAAILILCVLYTFLRVKEMPPQEYAEFHGLNPNYLEKKTVVPGQLKASRGVFQIFFLGIVTLGVYPLIVFSNVSREINITAKEDGKKTRPYWLFFLLSFLSFGILLLVWWFGLSKRIEGTLSRKGIKYSFSVRDFWIFVLLVPLLFAIIGSVLIYFVPKAYIAGVVLSSVSTLVPIVFLHRICRSLNLINANFNSSVLGVDGTLEDTISDLVVIAPKTFWTVGLVQFFCWAAFLYMWTYTNGAIALNVWDTTDTASAAYQTAGNWVGVLFAVQAVGSLVWAAVLPRFKNIRVSYVVSLLVGAVGFASVTFIHNQYLLFVSYFLIGFAWAAMLALPFTLLTNALQGSPHMGSYLGLFNCTICLPQIVAAATGGLVMRLVGGSQPMMLLIAGIFLVLGAASVALVKVRKTN